MGHRDHVHAGCDVEGKAVSDARRGGMGRGPRSAGGGGALLRVGEPRARADAGVAAERVRRKAHREGATHCACGARCRARKEKKKCYSVAKELTHSHVIFAIAFYAD